MDSMVLRVFEQIFIHRIIDAIDKSVKIQIQNQWSYGFLSVKFSFLPCGIIVLGMWLSIAPLISVGAVAVVIMPCGQTKPGCMPYWVQPYWARVIGEIIPFAAICCILRMARSFSVSANLTTIEDDAP